MSVGFPGLTEGLLAGAFARSTIAKAVLSLEPADLGVITEVNDAFCRLAGRERDALVGPPGRVWPVEAEGTPLSAVLDRLARGEATEGQAKLAVIRPAGPPVPVVCHLVAAGSVAVAELVEGTDREAARLRTTIRVQQDITAATGDRAALLGLITDRTFEVLPSAQTCVVQVVDEEHGVLHTVAGSGRMAAPGTPPTPLGGSLSGLAVTTGHTVRCDDTETDPRVDAARAREVEVRSALAAPLRVSGAGQPIGVLLVASGRPNAFGDDDEHQIALIAHAMGGALRHAEDAARTATLLAERTRALTALQISENRFRLVFDNSPLGLTLISLDPDSIGRYLAANPAMTRITGYTADELAGLTYRDLVHPDNAAVGADHLNHFTSGPSTPTRAEYRYRHKNGHDVWVAVSTNAVCDDADRPLYLVDQIEDITEKRTAEIELRRQARMLELIPAAVIIRDLDGTIRWWNQGASALYGWPADQAAGQISHQLLDTALPAGSSLEDLQDALLADGRWEGELGHVTAAGYWVTVLSRQVLHQPAGEEAQILEINADITAARVAEQALIESERRFRAQFAHSAAGQVICTLGGRFLDVNPAFAGMLGHPVGELLERSYPDLLDPGELGETQALLTDLIGGHTDCFTQQSRLLRADGRWISVDATVSLVRDYGGRPKHLIGVIIDSTDQRAAERARDQAADELADRNDQLETADRLKHDIIQMLSYEIRNPLASIRGYAEILDDDWAGLDDAFRDRAISAVARQADRLDEVVREVLAMVAPAG